jgi:hypothetical protein
VVAVSHESVAELDDDDDDDEQFEMLLDELGIRSVIGSDDQVNLGFCFTG